MNASYSLTIIALVALILTVNSIWANQQNIKTSTQEIISQPLK